MRWVDKTSPSSILDCKIQWIEELVGYSPWGSRVGCSWTHTQFIYQCCVQVYGHLPMLCSGVWPFTNVVFRCMAYLFIKPLEISWCFSLVRISSVTQLCPTLRSHESQHARPPCPSPTPGVHPNPCPLSRWCHPAISSSVIPFSSCPQSFPALGSSPMSQLFAWGGQSIGSFSFNISPSNEHPGLISFRMDWLDLLVVQGTIKSLLQHHRLKASILRCSAFFLVFRSHHLCLSRIIWANNCHWLINLGKRDDSYELKDVSYDNSNSQYINVKSFLRKIYIL